MIGTTSQSRAIHRRLLLAGAAIVLTTLAGCAASIAIAASSVDTLNHQVTNLLALDSTTEDLQFAIADEERAAFDYFVNRRQDALDAFRDAEARELVEYEPLLASTPAVAQAATHVREATADWRRGWIEPFLAAAQAGRPLSGEDSVRASDTYGAPMMAAVDNLAALVRQEEDNALTRAQAVGGSIAALLTPVGLVAVIVIALTWWWVTRTVSRPLLRLNLRAKQVIAGADLPFVAERDDEIGELAEVLERLRLDAAGRYDTARLEADRAAVFNQLAELISFAQDEAQLVDAAIKTLRRIETAPRGDVMLVNNSTNRLVVSGGWGDDVATGTPARVDRIERCPGIRRATAYVANDLSDDMAVHCPAHPAETGSVACVPMPALGTIVGVVHLEHPEPRAFDVETIAVIARVAEQVALAIANARLMHTMEGLAMTDPLTGLHNPRFFNGYLDQELAEAARDRESTSLLMLDVDHFKVFNDTHGHPAGDEALRTFARVLRGSVRSSDVIARYGGEEFVIALHRTTLADAQGVAEKIRAAVEQAVVDIGPGQYARITVSIGIAASSGGGMDPKGLIALADAALYRAKEAGRNRVELASGSESELTAAAERRAPRAERARPISHLRRGRVTGAGPGDGRQAAG